MKVKTLFNIFLVVVAIVLATLAIRSILRPEKYKTVYHQRSEEIRARLITVRAVQQVYRNEFKKYASDIDSLVDFVNYGKVSIIKTSGEIPEGMSEEDAFKAGIIKKVTETLFAKDKIIETDPNITYESLKNFEFIPYCDGKKFEIKLGTLTSGATKYEIPVYRIDVPINDVLANLDKSINPKDVGVFSKLWNKLFFAGLAQEAQFKSQYKPMWLGSLTDASTSGSWE